MKQMVGGMHIPKRDFMQRKIRRVHFVGIGGIGMSGIAEVLINLGYQVSGSDLKAGETTERLISLGARIWYEHRASNSVGADVVVVSSAIVGANPEIEEACRIGIPVIPRAEMLAELLKMKFSIAVSGCHGKTTTTSMIATILAHGSLDPTMVIGGKLRSIESNAKLGNGEVIVAEADESDGSFLKLNPSIAVVTNIDYEHLDHYVTIENMKAAFARFANAVPFYGAAVLCSDNEHVQDIIPAIKRRIITYGLNNSADYQATDISFEGYGSRFSLHYRDIHLGEVRLNVPGLCNVYNAMAAIAVAGELDMEFPLIGDGIADFRGVQRRMEIKGEKKGITVVDDYGHHPTEIKETLKAARRIWKTNRIIAVFQPHRYTRTQAVFGQFLNAFEEADTLIVTDIYSAGEKAIEGVCSEVLCMAIRKEGRNDVHYIADYNQVPEFLEQTAMRGDVVLIMGAGNIKEIAGKYLSC